MKTAANRTGCIHDPNLTYEAEPREVKLRKIISGETNDVQDGVFPTIYTEKRDGVMPEYDIRTDRFEVALDAMDKINKSTASKIAKNKGETEAAKEPGPQEKTEPEKS